MRNLLLSTSAAAIAVAAAAPAGAADWDVRVGGYYNAMVAYATTDGNGVTGQDFDGVDVSTNAEIHFLPSITLDNGIKIGANVQLEAETDGDQIDESYVQIQGSFGEVLIGSENSAGYKMTYAAPNAAIISLNSPSTGDYIAWSATADSVFRGTLGTTFLEVERNNDAKRLTYFTPRFAGFQLGLSYAHDANQDNFGPTDIASGSGNVAHIFDVGANYVQSFGDFNVAVSGRYGVAQNQTAGFTADTPTIYSFGINLGYAGFTIGGSFAEANEHNNGVDDGTAYDIGASYETGPWTFSVTYFHGENGEPGGTSDEQDTFGAAVDYKLAKGVRLNLFGAYVDFDAGAGPAADRDGWVIGTGIGLDF
jgi:predicted porin